MKKIIIALIFLLTIVSFNGQAQTVVYNGRYGYDAIVHVDDQVIFKGRYGSDALAHISDGVIYTGRYGYDAIAHVKDGVLYEGDRKSVV